MKQWVVQDGFQVAVDYCDLYSFLSISFASSPSPAHLRTMVTLKASKAVDLIFLYEAHDLVP